MWWSQTIPPSLLALPTQSFHLNRWGHPPRQAKLKDGLKSLLRNCTGSIRLLHQSANRKWGKAALVNLQSNVNVLKMMKFRHIDSPSPSRCVISFLKTSSTTQSRLLAMKIARNDSLRSLDEPNALCSHEPKLHEPKLFVCKSLNCKTQGSSPARA
ncbi:hypothetical protein ACFX1Z_001748 [Malus domestica]